MVAMFGYLGTDGSLLLSGAKKPNGRVRGGGAEWGKVGKKQLQTAEVRFSYLSKSEK